MSRRGRGGKNRHHRAGGRQEQQNDNQGGGRPNQRQDSSQRQNAPAEHGGGGGGGGGERQVGKSSFPSITQPRRNLNRPAKEISIAPKPANRVYKVVFFDTIAQAKADLPNLKTIASQCDQLNIVVRAESAPDDHDLNSVGKLFCGAAWALIHDRRKQDGWYDAPHE